MFFEICFEVTLPTVQGIRFFPRIIVLTDGMATPETVTGCADFNPDMIERLKVDKPTFSDTIGLSIIFLAVCSYRIHIYKFMIIFLKDSCRYRPSN